MGLILGDVITVVCVENGSESCTLEKTNALLPLPSIVSDEVKDFLCTLLANSAKIEVTSVHYLAEGIHITLYVQRLPAHQMNEGFQDYLISKLRHKFPYLYNVTLYPFGCCHCKKTECKLLEGLDEGEIEGRVGMYGKRGNEPEK
eukprot:TRINITY_DN3170_c0_g3_i3.p1 TRINITY_DN3170_c0_g3~~TRINITY_DN3170_c0_g3_i3.p1  ORF type:complete len:145 (+),score=26.19 TRINITY_DN3170_c0_g3_i3:351-785(+)